MKKHFLLFAAIAVALAGCKKQSELSLDNIKDVATISGYVSYSTGQYAEENNYSTEVTAPAAGMTRESVAQTKRTPTRLPIAT